MLLFALFASSAAAKAPRIVERCLVKGERARAVEFRAADGVRLRGVLLGTGQTGIVLGHQSRGSLCEWLPFARQLAWRGYRALSIDFRGNRSSGSARGLGVSAYDRDYTAASAFLARRGAKKVVFVGASMGGTAALVAAAALEPNAPPVIAFSAPTQYSGLNAADAVKKLDSPTLFLAGESDSFFADEARALYEASKAPRRQLAIRPSSAHGARLLTGRDGVATRDLVLAFLQTL
jgi:pimeloyl-ACP methyl ester carboxylesterase